MSRKQPPVIPARKADARLSTQEAANQEFAQMKHGIFLVWFVYGCTSPVTIYPNSIKMRKESYARPA